MKFLGFFYKCETDLLQIIKHSVTKARPTPKCKQNAAGCEPPCVAAEAIKLPGNIAIKIPGHTNTKCVYNKKVVDEMKEDPGGLWSTRGCGLHYF